MDRPTPTTGDRSGGGAPLPRRRRRVVTALMVALALAGGCGRSTGDTDTLAADEPPATTPAGPAAAGEPTEEPSDEPATVDDGEPTEESTEEPGPLEGGVTTELFPGVAEFGIAFDISNAQLNEHHDHERLDITSQSVQLPDPGRAGAFVIAMADGEAIVGGWADADGAVTTLAVTTTAGSRAGLSAILSIMAATAPSDDASIDAFWAALGEVADGEAGIGRYLLLGDRAVVLERPDDGPRNAVSLVVAGPLGEADAYRVTPSLRAAMADRQQA